MEYLKAFLCGGLLCLIGQVLIDLPGQGVQVQVALPEVGPGCRG